MSRSMRVPTERPVGRATPTVFGGLALALGLVGCGVDGPDPVRDGDYRALASSAGSLPPGVAMTVAGSEVTIAGPQGSVTATLSGLSDELTLCPPNGKGEATRLGEGLSAAGVELTSPAVFGDCGDTSPERVTIVDLDSYDDTQGFPFARWVEFCLASDSDCPE